MRPFPIASPARERAMASTCMGMPTRQWAPKEATAEAAWMGSVDGAVRQGLNIHPSKAPYEEVPDAVRSGAGKKDRRSLARPHKGRHAAMEEVHGQLQVPFGEKESLCLPRAAGGAEGDDPGHVVLANRQKTEGVAGEVRRGGEGDAGDFGKGGQGLGRDGGQTATVERRIAAGVIDGLVDPPELVVFEGF